MKTDLKVVHRDLFSAKQGEFTEVLVPPLNYLMIDGHGDPNTAPEYISAIDALYAVSYTLKFFSKNDLQRDYGVPPLEGLWWSANMAAFTTGAIDDLDWTIMTMLPEWINQSEVEAAVASVRSRKPVVRAADVRFEMLDEGFCVQTLHIGPYSEEGPTLRQLHEEYLPARGFVPTGKHHEIYLSDPRRVDPSKLKVILRQPVAPI